MASPADAVAVTQPNGLADLSPQSQPQSDSSQPVDPSAKRKREASDDGSSELSINGNGNSHGSDHGDNETKGAKSANVNGDHPLRDESSLIRDYFNVLQKHDTKPSILKRPLPEPSTSEEPQSKRQKSDDDSRALCIEDKINQGSYKLLDHLVLDLRQVIQDSIVEIRAAQSADVAEIDQDALIQLNNFRDTAMALHSREMSYPERAPLPAKDGPPALDDIAQGPSSNNTVLTLFGTAQQPRTLFSSLPKRKADPGHPEDVVKPLADVPLPNGISLSTVLPSTFIEKPSRVSTLGELFPSPSNLPPLQPPKASKTTTKSKILGFYHPELAGRSRYRQGSYFSADLTTGVWLDYSNATPPSKSKSRQRERTLSLAGQKPSSADVEMTELEALFRGAFSSFAPEKDDSGAVVSSGEVARIWYQRHGHRYMEQMIEAELAGDESEDASDGLASLPVDEDAIANIVEKWDDSLVDPALSIEDVLGKKTDEEKEVDDTLQEISDLIETLSSYQRNRNMTLPTSQNRNSADPAKADMLNGPLAQEPTDEEREIYQMLKDQLAVIIQGLPPYAVARLNSDKLEELNVSTKLEVRSDVFRGVLEDDSTSARHRHQQQAAQAAQTPRQPQRTPSFHNSAAYPGQQYSRPYQAQTQTPVPIPNHYQQSPARPSIPPNFSRQVSAPMQSVSPQQHRPVAGQPFARPNGYTPQPMQQARPYGTPSAIPAYQASSSQPRMAPGYPGGPQPGGPGQRYPSGYAGYNAQQQPQPGMQTPYHQQAANFPPHMNGAGSIPPRTMSPQVPQYQAGQNYSPRPGQQPVPRAAQPYGTPGQPGAVPRYPSNGAQQNPPHSPAPAGAQGAWVNPMSPQRQYEQQLQARNQAAARMNAFETKIQNHGVAGLGGIGLGATPADMGKFNSQVRPNMPGGVSQSSPSPRPVSAAGGLNGVPQPSPSPAPAPGATPSPAPSTAMQPQAPA